MALRISFLSVIFLLTVNFAQAQTDKITYYNIGDDLAPLRIVNAQQHVITNEDFHTKNHIFLVMFSPTCDHCLNMGEMFEQHASLFKNSLVVFMTSEKMKNDLSYFAEETKINRHPEFILGYDSNNSLNKLYTYGTLPQINIYDSNKKLVATYKGENPLEVFQKYLP